MFNILPTIALVATLVCSATASTPLKQATSHSSCLSSVLQHPTAVTAYKDGVSTKDHTFLDGFKVVKKLKLPFRVGIYGLRRKEVYILGGGSLETFPNQRYSPTYWYVYNFKNATITKGLDQGIFYSIEGKAPHRTANIEWRIGDTRAKIQNTTWHFGVQWYEDDPDLARIKYWNVPEPAPEGFVEINYYRGYYYRGIPDPIKSGDVLLVKSAYETRFKLGPRSACNYQGPGTD